ncbi:hypothetical protein WN944_029517 [Citrus x changshan-huyou]|uniref:Uncharacterized protein n=1 Tax=Citrus x changshan-huyou TaxID=2935761 RepID=A0AAP0LM68_9ROSI
MVHVLGMIFIYLLKKIRFKTLSTYHWFEICMIHMVTLYEKQIKGCSNGGRKRYLEKGGNNKLLNREWRQYLKCTKRGLKVVRGGLGEHRGMESENEEVNEIVESNGLKVEQLPLNIDNWGEGKVR